MTAAVPQCAGGATRAKAPPRIAIVITSAFPLNAFLRPHLEHLAGRYAITVYVNTRDMGVAPDVPIGVRVEHVNIRREISPWHDAVELLRLCLVLRRERYDLVFSMNPKSGLLAMLATWFTRVPLRIHCFTGQVWATRRGVARAVFKALDRLLAACASEVLCDSPSQRDFLIAEGVVAAPRIRVLGDGSIAGVDPARFHPDAEQRATLRATLGIGAGEICVLYVGRLHREKGLPELLTAFRALRQRRAETRLLVVGPDDGGFAAQFAAEPGVIHVGYTPAVESYMMAADVLCMPSHREGFGLVLIEAGACGLPVVASRIYGITDAVVDGETGLLHRPGDAVELAATLERLYADPVLRRRLGENGRRRAIERFPRARLTAALGDLLAARLGGKAGGGLNTRGVDGSTDA